MEEFRQMLIQYLPDIIFAICNVIAYILVIVLKVGFNKAKDAMSTRVTDCVQDSTSKVQKMKDEVAEVKAENEQLRKEMKELKDTLIKALDFDEVNKNG